MFLWANGFRQIPTWGNSSGDQGVIHDESSANAAAYRVEIHWLDIE